MTLRVGIGFSKKSDTEKAAKDAAQQALDQLNQDPLDLAIVFNTTNYDSSEFLPVIYNSLDRTRIIGTSTSGIMLPGGKTEKHGIGIITLASENITFESGHISHLNLQDIHVAGKNLVKESLTDFQQQQRKLILLFADGLLNNMSALLSGVEDGLKYNSTIIGAGSCDDFSFDKTYQYHQETSMTQGAVACFLSRDLHFGASCKHGLKPLGKPRNIDSVEGHIIKSIDGKKAINIYEEFFEKEALTLQKSRLGQINIRYPLGIFTDDRHEYLTRNVINTLDDGSLVCQDNVDENSEVHIMIGNKNSYLKAAQEAALDVKKQLKGEKPKLILIIESLTRQFLLGRSACQEMNLIQNVLGNDVPIIGIQSCKEIFTFKYSNNIDKTLLQNESIIILALK